MAPNSTQVPTISPQPIEQCFIPCFTAYATERILCLVQKTLENAQLECISQAKKERKRCLSQAIDDFIAGSCLDSLFSRFATSILITPLLLAIVTLILMNQIISYIYCKFFTFLNLFDYNQNLCYIYT